MEAPLRNGTAIARGVGGCELHSIETHLIDHDTYVTLFIWKCAVSHVRTFTASADNDT